MDGFTDMIGSPGPMPPRPINWMVEMSPGYWLELAEWEIAAYEEALRNGHDTVTYTFPVKSKSPNAIEGVVYWSYTIDLINMTQKNECTGTTRRLMRIVNF